MEDHSKLIDPKNSEQKKLKFESARRKSENYDKKLKRLDNTFALFRLISIITFLAVIVSLFKNQSASTNFLFIVLFLIYCLLTSWIHNVIQMNQKKWKAISLSYQLSILRMDRNFEKLENEIAPWHKECISVPKGHIYSSDLDIHSQLFLLFNTCSTKNGSSKLFKLFMEAGITPCDSKSSKERSLKSKLLSKQSILLRRFESLKLDENFLQKFYKENEKNKEKNNSKNENEIIENQNISENKYQFHLRNIYSIINFLAWVFILLPTLINFIQNPNIELLIQPLFLYSMFLLFGVFIFTPVTEKAEKISQSSKKIEQVIKALSKSQKSVQSLNLSFLEPTSIKEIDSLNFLINLISLRGNFIFWITLHIFFPFDAIICFVIQLKLKSIEKKLPIWEEELYEFDLLSSFARFHLENSMSHFLTEEERNLASPDYIEFVNMGHPLIPEYNRISNTLKLNKTSPVILLTGSNMAGKSTFLRTFGINVLLANMGAPVCASRFIVKPSRLLCAIRIDDSLSDGTSYFYAEVKRLKFILDALDNKNKIEPSIFLIDEIFRGTNNKERYIGSLNIIHSLFDKNSFGIISTHDLALADMNQSDTRLRNMHFREHVENNKLIFDYLIKEGPCPTTNALFIMKQEGLPIP
jgi:hypothetical protein